MPTEQIPAVFKAHNTEHVLPTDEHGLAKFPIHLTVLPLTDLWRKPLSTFSENQPTYYVPIPLKRLLRAAVTLQFKPVHLYDQAGIAILWPNHKDRWIKAGIEYVDEQLKKSVVAPGVGGWSDWSVSGSVELKKDVEIAVRREGGAGSALLLEIDGVIVRELHWVFEGEEVDEEVWVGMYGARPADVEELLVVQVKKWELEVKAEETNALKTGLFSNLRHW